ncbi:MAG: chemotaxis protein CheB [Bacillota bacterium]
MVRNSGHRKKTCPIVGIGASAGGLEAFIKLLENLPLNTGMAFVFVQHLDPKQESKLTSILSRRTSIPISEVKENTPVQPDHAYVMPPEADLEISHGVLKRVPRKNKTGLHMPVDLFLETLAKEHGSEAIGVILSGNATDGSRGIKEIKAVSGITFAQAPTSAKYVGMPLSAIDTGAVDYILTPEEIARELARIAYFHTDNVKMAKTEPFSDSDIELGKIFDMLRAASGVKFSNYKRLTVKRRILQRMNKLKMDKLGEYVEYLGQNPAEVNALRQDILINVTSFFRDPEAYLTLMHQVIPCIIKNRMLDEEIRIWVPGCSTGEEAYSIAICLLEILGEPTDAASIKIFGTDINEVVIDKARNGFYPKSIEENVSTERLKCFFIQTDKGYHISDTVRDLCIFAKHDITKDPPFSRLDLISCRNLMIYLNSDLHQRVFPTLHYALKPQGFLILGTSESVGTFADLFDLVDRKYKVYAKKAILSPISCTFSPDESPAVALDYDYDKRLNALPSSKIYDVQKAADRIVLSQHAPAGVIVTSNLEIIQFRGHTGAYLEPACGMPSMKLLKMARDGLLLGLRAAINEAIKDKITVRKEELHVLANGHIQIINLYVIPLEGPFPKGDYFLILFKDVAYQTLPEGQATGGGQRVLERIGETDENIEIIRLKQELVATKEYLQSIIDQYESANEELRSANEEIQTSNEELQSINEEMETAKEELQSTNEELITLNEEMQNRNKELGEISSDIYNLFRSINVAVVILSSDMRIRSFNAKAETQLNIIATDVGRPIGNLNTNIVNIDLEQAALEVLESLNTREQEVQDRWGCWYSMQIRPYKTMDNIINGTVITFMDIDIIKKSLETSQEALELTEAIVETIRQPLLVLDGNLRLKMANQAFYQTFQVANNETENQLIYELGNGQWNIPDLRLLLDDILTKGTSFQNFKVSHDFPYIGYRSMLINARRLVGNRGQTKMILMAFEDITENIGQ